MCEENPEIVEFSNLIHFKHSDMRYAQFIYIFWIIIWISIPSNRKIRQFSDVPFSTQRINSTIKCNRKNSYKHNKYSSTNNKIKVLQQYFYWYMYIDNIFITFHISKDTQKLYYIKFEATPKSPIWYNEWNLLCPQKSAKPVLFYFNPFWILLARPGFVSSSCISSGFQVSIKKLIN